MPIQHPEQRLQAYDQRRRSFLDEIAELPPNLLAEKPGAKRWSLIQVVEHLVAAERFVLLGLPDPAQLKHRPVALRNRLAYFLVLGVLKWHIPVPVPARDMLPEGNLELDTLRERWNENIDWLRGAADRLSSDPAVFLHPVSGPLTPPQALRLAGLHLATHLRQARRIRQALKDDRQESGSIDQHQ